MSMGLDHALLCVACSVFVCASMYEFRGQNSIKGGRM